MITGLSYIADYLDPETEKDLVSKIDALPWFTDLGRRVQQYGIPYNYTTRTMDWEKWVDVPEALKILGERLVSDKFLEKSPNQVIVNEYVSGQGIAPHTDADMNCDTAISISMLSPVIMKFKEITTDAHQEQDLAPRSAVILKEDAFFKWRHYIPKRHSDQVGNVNRPRGRRVSLTFRHCVKP